MLKRGAQGPQGSKEDEGIFGMASTPDDKPVRATAAQLASRKIKDVRKRRAPTPTTGGGASDVASFNPFASAAPAAAPAPTQSTGFTFGQTQSQSFPGASSGPSQGGIFSSGTNGQASSQTSFGFSAGPTSFGSAPSSNPFSVNTSFGGNSQSSTSGFSFGGFNAGNQSTPSFGGFGAQPNTSTPAKPALFGQSTAQMTSPADDSMQTSPDTKPKGASMFSSKPAAGPSALSNPFSNLSGQNAPSNLFAPKAFATEKPAEKPAETQPFKPLFGSTPADSKPADGEKQQPTASNPFANLTGQAPTSSTNLFAPKPTVAEQTSAKPAEAGKPFGALFGSIPSSQPSGPASNLFAPKPAAEEPKASNPFANLSAPSPFGALSSPNVTGTESSVKAGEAQPFKSMFGTPAASKVLDAGKEQTTAPAFGNMFSPKPAAEKAAAIPTADQPFKSMFGTPTASKTLEAGKEQTASPAFGNLFSHKPAAESTGAKSSEDKPLKPVFGAPVAEKEQLATSSIFAPKVTSEGQTPVPAQTSQFGSMFGVSPAPSKSGKEKTTQVTPSNPFANLSGQNAFSNPFAPKPTEQAATPQASNTSLFGASTAVGNNKDTNIAALNGSLTSPFTAGPKVSNESRTEGATIAATPHVSFAQSPRDHKSSSCLPVSSSSSLPSSSSTSIVSNTFAASDSDSLFPRPDQPVSIEFPVSTEDFDAMPLKRLFPEKNRDELRDRAALLMKIGVLTESFKREVAKCDPMTDDIDEVLILYAELRRELGVPIGSINPEEDAKRAAINKRDDAQEAADGNAPSRIPTPPAFVPLGHDDRHPAPSNKPSGGSTTSSKFAQSFSAPNPAPATTSAGASSALIAGPSSPAAVPVSAAPVAPAKPYPPTASPVATFAAPTAVEPPKFGDAATSTTTPAFGVSKIGAVVTSTTSSAIEAPKSGDAATSTTAPAFQIPKFDGAATSTTAPAFQIPKFDGAATSTAASAFQVPKLGGKATGIDFSAQFKTESDKTIAKAKAQRKALEFDSDEDDEEEWERKDEERQRAKRAEIEAAAKKRAVFVPGVGFKFADDNAEEPATSAAPATPPQGDSAGTGNSSPHVFPPFVTPSTTTSAEANGTPSASAVNSTPPVFPPFVAPSTAASAGANGTSSLSSSNYQPRFPTSSSPQSSEFSTLVGTAQRSPADAALFGGKPASPPPFFGAFGAGPPSSSSGSSVFGSSSKPVPASQNIFGGLKPTSPKRKASADEGEKDDDSPAKKPKSSQNIFGGPKPAEQNIFGGLRPASPKRKASVDGNDDQDDSPAKKTKPSPPPSSVGANMFGQVSTAPLAPSTNFSAQPAMTTPSAPPTQPISNSTEDEDGEPGEIFDLTKGNGGEEEETLVFEDKSRVFKLEDKWYAKGTGPVRLLKHPVTGRARIVARADPSGNVTLNILLKKEFDYKLTTNSVQFLVPNETGELKHWAVRVKGERLQEFHQLINEIKN
ncbi:Nucleoporin nup61 [Penicillium digitatum]|uniref:Nucleoporin nup61 n=3 Tax=Penicillium digitatum TaxID=36651 RepID=K9FFT2_PEND2|nr:Nucleoporin nup61 [Penicillium digitatum Pd1]EKV07002.1 Nucleoporin nup61 [Penicillium digitatum PHI26]EKV13967.1 Nucleoporin nup61 [Penicillium digitatum Pd1]KAG0160900.1 hypothetical protein PDIDSM_8432 [Penicillium digitatum]QQK46225.1 Nucleoporin nup61 [Penicillium digitatum]